MKLLQNFLKLEEATDLTVIPPDAMTALEKNIRDGAADASQEWSNALHLVHEAFRVAQIERPTPSMRGAWKQYEELLLYAVEQLSKARGMESDWRMSSSMFHEAMQSQKKFRVSFTSDKSGESYTVKTKDIEDVIDSVKTKNTELYDVDVKNQDGNTATLTFSKWGIKKNYLVKIEKII